MMSDNEKSLDKLYDMIYKNLSLSSRQKQDVIDYYYIISMKLKKLTELELKEIPMKAVIDEDFHCFDCIKCGVTWGYTTVPYEYEYCPNCGQKLDWGDK